MRKHDTSNGKHLDLIFSKRECQVFICNTTDQERCFCGRNVTAHSNRDPLHSSASSWNPTYHTFLSPTDAFGTILFQHGAHMLEAQYLRLAFDSRTDHILHLLTKQWGLELPKLVISVHGGRSQFQLPEKLRNYLKNGLMKIAKTTRAWILTDGTNGGIAEVIGESLSSERSSRLRNTRLACIGIAPWGMLENRHSLVGRGKRINYVHKESSKSKSALINLSNRHNYFLFADNGTCRQGGHELILRRRLEKSIGNIRLQSRNRCNIPLACLIVEGDLQTIQTVTQYIMEVPATPVIVIEGSGKASDLIIFACRYMTTSTKAQELRAYVLESIQSMFSTGIKETQVYFSLLELCAEKRDMIHIVSPDSTEGCCSDLDFQIMGSLLENEHLAPQLNLNLTLIWNRVDLARQKVFKSHHNWTHSALHETMMDALAQNRVDFVRLLLEQGVNMSQFLTIPRLEELYNSKAESTNTLRYLVADVRPTMIRNYKYTLFDIGLVINKLMKGTYKSSFSSRKFRRAYTAVMRKTFVSLQPSLLQSVLMNETVTGHEGDTMDVKEAVAFRFPFNELLVWAVLTNRHSMAKLMWQHGEEALAKALIACCLYKSMAEEAADDDLEAEVCEELRKNAIEFEDLALELVDHCHKKDDDLTVQLLTCAQPNWDRQTCLHLAVVAKLKSLLSHPSAQILLADLWMGGLRARKSPNAKVVFALLFPPIILKLDFKSEEELQLMPQTEEEYFYEIDKENLDIEESERLDGTENELEEINDEEQTDVDSKKSEASSVISQRGLIANIGDATTEAEPLTGNKPPKPLKLKKKVYEFYGAPITKFWVHSIAYFIFLFIYSYTVLIRTLPVIEWNEYYVLSYVVTLSMEKVREIAATDGVRTWKKIRVWANSGWNICDTIAILTFIFAFFLRLDPNIIPEARVIYSINIIYWYVRILRILSVSKFLGPLVTLLFRYFYTMAYFVVLLCVFLFGYGVFRQSLLYPENEPTWESLRNVTFQPYFMIYGELFKEEIDASCGEPGLDACVTGRWLNPLVMTFYLLMSIVLLLNMLIAVFNSIFIRKNPVALKIWMFQRYAVVLDYEGAPSLPPPFIIVSHIIILGKLLHRRSRLKYGLFDRSLKLYLDEKRLELIRDFEEECMEDLVKDKNKNERLACSANVHEIQEQLKTIQYKLDAFSSLPSLVLNKIEVIENTIKNKHSGKRMLSISKLPYTMLETPKIRQGDKRSLENLKSNVANSDNSISHSEND
ncbi:transient receptor potential cation channel trpm-like isoform X1 [Artemia franciscana]|uniref:transient receptor potential cation channel trpm-like isoform X1 n=2 Tax=Artemia franciscana TaxID=6661 RepID=UPI0032DBDFEB